MECICRSSRFVKIVEGRYLSGENLLQFYCNGIQIKKIEIDTELDGKLRFHALKVLAGKADSLENGGVPMPLQYQSDIQAILAKRYDNGADYWTTPDKRLIKGVLYNA